MKGKQFILCVALAFLAGLLVYSAIQRKHTFTLSNEDGGVKAEQIQPVFGTVKVSGDMDTDVVLPMLKRERNTQSDTLRMV